MSNRFVQEMESLVNFASGVVGSNEKGVEKTKYFAH